MTVLELMKVLEEVEHPEKTMVLVHVLPANRYETVQSAEHGDCADEDTIRPTLVIEVHLPR